MSGNLALVVDQAGARLEIGSHNTLVLVHADGRRERVGIRALGALVLHGDVQLSTQVLQALATQGVALTMLSRRGRSLPAGFGCAACRRPQLRHAQHLAYGNAPQRLDLARRVLWAKLEGMAEFTRSHCAELEIPIYQAIHAATQAHDIATLMGIEGAAAAKYFEVLAMLYDKVGVFVFGGRSRRPPLDPPNALMSLCYTLAQAQATQLVLHAGLDAQLGFLHALHRDRESLALDLIEPARPALDAWVLNLLSQRRALAPDVFIHAEDGGVWLSKTGRAVFYPLWFRDGYRVALKPMRALLATLLGQLRMGMIADTDTLCDENVALD